MEFGWILVIVSIAAFCNIGCVLNANSTARNEAKRTTTKPPMISTTTSGPDILEMWRHNDVKSKEMISRIIRSLLPTLLEQSGEIEISAECQADLVRYFFGISRLQPWAFKMLDATGKIMDGIMNGAFTSFGSYDQCIDIAAPMSQNSEKIRFTGKYCTVMIRPPLPPKPRFYVLKKKLPIFQNFTSKNAISLRASQYAQLFYFVAFRFGVCVPSSCTSEDIYQAAKSFTKDVYLNISVPRCETKEPMVVEGGQISMVAVLSFIGLIVSVATFLDVYYLFFARSAARRPKGNLAKVILGFSAYSNTAKLLDTSSSSQQLRMLHGVRFLSMTWIVLGHQYFFGNFQVFRNLNEVINFSKDVAFEAIINASLAVDTFFFISGLLVVYVTMKILDKTKGKFSIPVFIIHRYWRVTPLNMIFVGATILLPWFGSGPIWHESIDGLVDACKKDWWSNLLLINNIYYTHVPCVSHSWYLAADMQLYIVSLLVIIPLYRWPRIAMIINFLLALASMITIGVQNFLGDYPPTMLFSQPDPEQRWLIMRQVYYMPYLHMGPYCVGMALGYFLYKNRSIKLRPMVQVIGWIVAIFFNMSVLYGVYDWNQGDLPSKPVATIYAATHRTVWSLGVAWVTLTCVTGYGGFINTLLSWKALIPLSRLTFPVYLVHPLIQKVFHASFREQVQTAHFLAVFSYFGFLATSYAIGYVLTLLIESPMLSLERMLLSRHDDEVKKDEKVASWRKEEEEGRGHNRPKMSKPKKESHKDHKSKLTKDKTEEMNGIDNASFVCRL